MRYKIAIIIIIGILLLSVVSAFAAPTSTIINNLILPNLTNKSSLGTDANGLVGAGSGGGGGAGSFTATSSNVGAANGLIFFNGTNNGSSSASLTYTSSSDLVNIQNLTVNGTCTGCGGAGSGFTDFSTTTASGKYTVATTTSKITLTIPSNLGFFSNDIGYLKTQSLPTSTAWLDSQLLFGQLGNFATSSALFTISTSTGVLTVSSSSLANISSTNITASGYGKFPTLYDFNNNKYVTSTAGGSDTFLSAGVDTQLLFGKLGGGATSSALFTISTSTGVLTVSSSSLANISSTNITASGNASLGSLSINAQKFTNLLGSGLTNSGNALTCTTANAATFGCLTSADWNTFNKKISVQNLPTSTIWLDGQLLFGQLGNTATSAASLTFSSSTNTLTIAVPPSGVTTTISATADSQFGAGIRSGGNIEFNGLGNLIRFFSDSTFATVWTTLNSAAANTLTISNTSFNANLSLANLTNDRTFTFPNVAGTFVLGSPVDGNLMFWNGIQATSSNLFSVSTSTGVLTVSSSSLANVSSTNLTASGYVQAAKLIGTGLVSGNCVQASTNGLLTTIASACGSGGGITNTALDGQLMFANLAGNATGSTLFSISTSTGVLSLPTSSITGNVSTTANVTIGGSLQANAGQFTFSSASGTSIGVSNVSSSNVSSTRLDVSGISTLASTTATYLSVGTTTIGTAASPFLAVGNQTSSILIVGATSSAASFSSFRPGCIGLVSSSSLIVWLSAEASTSIALRVTTSTSQPNCQFQFPGS